MARYFIKKEAGTIGNGDYRGLWSNSQTWASGDIVAPTQAYATAAARGYVYECTTGGAGGASEPTWVYTTPDTSTTTSGSATFTCREMDTWAKAGVYLDQGLQRCTAAGPADNTIIIQYNDVPTLDSAISADKTWSTLNSLSVISASNDGGSAYTPTPMDPTTNWLGNTTASYTIYFAGGADDKIYVYGVAFRTGSTTQKDIRMNTADTSCEMIIDNCYFWLSNSANSQIVLGGTSSFYDCTFRLGTNTQALGLGSSPGIELYNCVLSPSGSVPNNTFSAGGQGHTIAVGCDWSYGTTAMVGASNAPHTYIMERCKLPSAGTWFATQVGNPTRASSSLQLYDCSSGDTHGLFGYYNALGSAISELGIVYSSGAAGQSWKITTTGNATFLDPFVTPWIDLYHTDTSAITPYFEILRDGSAIQYQNDEVWAEFTAKTTANSTKASAIYRDRKDIDLDTGAANQADGAGTGSWTGEAGTAWSGKIDSGSSLTPAEAGHIRGRIAVGEPSITVYVDPQIRT